MANLSGITTAGTPQREIHVLTTMASESKSKSGPSTTTGRPDGQLLLASLKTLQEIAKYMRIGEPDVELKIFYADLTAYCAMIRSHSRYINALLNLNNSGRNMEIVDRIVGLLEAAITPGLLLAGQANLKVPDHTTSSKLRALCWSWDEIQNQQDDISRLSYLRSWLDFGTTSQQRNYFISILSSLEDELRASYVDQEAQQGPEDYAPTAKIKEPSFAVCNAAQSVFEALLACKDCPCTPSHDLCARLGLGTYRTSTSYPNSDEQDELYFDMLLSSEQDLQVARVRSARATTIQWAVGNEQSENLKRKPKPRSMKIKSLCEPMIKMRTMATYRLELKVARKQLFKLQSERDNFPVDKTKDPISLHWLLKEGSRSFTERTRRILAVILSFAVLHLHDTSWLPPAWGSSNIFFFPTTSSAIPLRPFIHIPIADTTSVTARTSNQEAESDLDPDDFDPDDIDPDDFVQHQCPDLVTLAIMLLEVYFVTPFSYLAKKYGVGSAGEGVESSGALRYIDANIVFEACKGEIPENSQFHYAVEKCLDPTIWEDENGERLDKETLSSKIYQEVVHPLETELGQAYSSIPLEDLDRFAQSLDFANWDQTITPLDASTASPGTRHDHQRAPSPQDLTLLSPRATSPFLSPPLPHRPHSRGSDYYKTSQFFDDEALPGSHSSQAKAGYSIWKSRYQEVYEKFIPSNLDPSSTAPVKIAVLDSGIDLSHPDIEARAENIKGRYNWLDGKHPRAVHDRNGHGTFVAGLLLDYAPDAELYIIKIADNKPSDPAIIAQAIAHAIETWNVDIITMSFGFPTCSIPSYDKLEDALMKAYSRGVLLFAAASNNGGKLGRSFPAREPTVIAVHSTDTNGNRSPFSPTAVAEDTNFATVGEAVESAWPVHLCDSLDGNSDDDPSWVVHKSGTSYATPIVAGIAAFLLTYARVHLPAEQAAALKSHKRMRAVLRRVAEKGPGYYAQGTRDGYYFVDLSLYADSLFGKDKAFVDVVLRDLLGG